MQAVLLLGSPGERHRTVPRPGEQFCRERPVLFEYGERFSERFFWDLSKRSQPVQGRGRHGEHAAGGRFEHHLELHAGIDRGSQWYRYGVEPDQYRSVEFSVFESESYVIIPLALFKVEEAADFLLLEHKPNQTDSILFNKIPELGIVNIFSVPGIVHEAMSQLFPNTAIEQHISYFITENIKSKTEHSVYCWTRNKRLDIMVFKEAKLQLINSFTYQTSEDFAYFVLNVYDKLELDMHKCPLILLNAREKPELREILEKYLKVNNK